MDPMRVRGRRRLLGASVAGAVALAISTTPVAAHDELHATHASPGNALVAADIHSAGIQFVKNYPGTGGHVMIQGNRLFLGSYGIGMRVFDISDPGNPKEVASYAPNSPRADAVPDAWNVGGRRFTVLNGTRRTSSPHHQNVRTDRTEFFEILRDPATGKESLKLLWTFGPDQIDGESHNGDVYDARHLYFPSGGSGIQGLRIYDLRPLYRLDPSGAQIASAPWNLFRGDPTKLWEVSPHRRGRPVGNPFTHTHDITIYPDHPVRRADGTVVRRDIALLAEGGNYTDANGNTGSMFVIDVTNPASPVVLLRWLHQTGTGHHPIRYHHEAQFLDGDRSVVLITDEDLHNGCGGAGGTTAIRLSPDLTSATELSEWFIPAGTPAPVCSVHVFDSHRNLAFFGSYNAGLQVVDYRDPKNPRQVDHWIAPGSTAWGAEFHKGWVYVGDMSRGLDVFRYPLPDLTAPGSNIVVGNVDRNGWRTLAALVFNLGDREAKDVVVRFHEGSKVIATRTIPTLGARGRQTVHAGWYAPSLAGRTVTVTVDPADAITELHETNNVGQRSWSTNHALDVSALGLL